MQYTHCMVFASTHCLALPRYERHFAYALCRVQVVRKPDISYALCRVQGVRKLDISYALCRVQGVRKLDISYVHGTAELLG